MISGTEYRDLFLLLRSTTIKRGNFKNYLFFEIFPNEKPILFQKNDAINGLPLAGQLGGFIKYGRGASDPKGLDRPIPYHWITRSKIEMME